MEENMQNNIDLNNNGIPDWAEEQQDDWENHPTEPGSPFSFAYKNEEQVAKLVPNYKDYKWYKQPEEGYYYSYGEKMENQIESNPEETKEAVEKIAEESPEVSKEDVKPIVEETEQLNDNDKRNDEVNNEAVEKAAKKIGSFMIDIPTKEVSQQEYNDMPLDDIEKMDAEAMKGEGDYLTVATDLGLEEDDLRYFEDPSFVGNLTEEQKEEVKNEPDKKKKMDILSKFMPVASAPDVPTSSPLSTEDTTPEEKEHTTIAPNPTTIGTQSSGGSASVASVDKPETITEDVNATHSTSASAKDLNISEMDANTGSVNGTISNNEGLDNTFDNLSFKHEENIKTNEQFELKGKEGHTSNSNEGVELPKMSKTDIKEALLADSVNWENGDSKGKFLPYRFITDGNDIIVSKIGTALKENFDSFIKKEPGAINEILVRIE